MSKGRIHLLTKLVMRYICFMFLRLLQHSKSIFTFFLSTDQRMIRPTDTPSFGDKNSSENRLPMPTDRPTKRTNLKRFFRVRELNIVRSKRICALRMFFSSVFVSACLCVGFFKPVSNSANALTLHVWCPLVDNVLTSFNNAMTFKG